MPYDNSTYDAKLTNGDRLMAQHLADLKMIDMPPMPGEDPSLKRRRLFMNGLAEIALCKYLGVQYVSAKMGGVRIGIKVGSCKIRVCHAMEVNKDLQVTEEMVRYAHVLALMEGNSDHRLTFAGWITVPDARQEGYYDKRGMWEKLIVPRIRLQRPSYLKRYLSDLGIKIRK